MSEPDLNAVRYVASRIPRAPLQLPKSPVKLRWQQGRGRSDATVLSPKKGSLPPALAQQLAATRARLDASDAPPMPEGVQLDFKAGGPSRMNEGKPRGYRAPLLSGGTRVGGPKPPPAPEPGVARGLKGQPGNSVVNGHPAPAARKVAGGDNGVRLGNDGAGFQDAHAADLSSFDRPAVPPAPTLEGRVVPSSVGLVHTPRQPRTARTLQTEMPGRTFAMQQGSPAGLSGPAGTRALGAGPAPSSGRTYPMGSVPRPALGPGRGAPVMPSFSGASAGAPSPTPQGSTGVSFAAPPGRTSSGRAHTPETAFMASSQARLNQTLDDMVSSRTLARHGI